jgi:hypothetical protein
VSKKPKPISGPKNKKNMKRIFQLFLLAVLVVTTSTAFSQITSTTTGGNWNATTTWVNGVVPGSNDPVIIAANATVTVNIDNAQALSVQINNRVSNNDAQLAFNANSQLTVGGTVTLNGNANNTRANLNMTSGGKLIATDIAVATATATHNLFTAGSGTINLTGSNSLPGTSSFATFNNLEVVSGVTTAAANLSIGGTLSVNTGATFNMAGFTLAVTGTVSNSGTVQTQNTTATALPSGKTWEGTVQFNAAGGGQTIPAATSFSTILLSNTSGTQTAAGAINALAINIPASTILNMSTFALNSTTVTNAGTMQTQHTATATPIPALTYGGTVQYNSLSGGQTVVATSYNNLTLSNTSGVQTAGGNVSVAGALITTTGGTFNLGTNTLGGTLAVTNNGTIRTGRASDGIPSRTWGGTIEYNRIDGGQALVDGTYATLLVSNSGSNTASGISAANLTMSNSATLTMSAPLAVSGTLTINSGSTLVMGTNAITTLGTAANSGTLKTENTATPYPAGKTWGGTIEFNGAAAQSIPSGTYSSATIILDNGSANTSGALSAAGLSVNSGSLTMSGALSATTLNIAATSTLNLQSNALTTTTTSGALGTIETANTSATPLSSGRTWPGTVVYNSGSAQTIVAGNYVDLNAAGGSRTISGTVAISGIFTKGDGSYTTTGSTVDFNGVNQTIPALDYNNLTITGSGNKTLSGTIRVFTTFSPGVGNTYIVTGSTIDFNSTTLQTIPAFNYDNLVISGNKGSSNSTLSGNIGVAGSFTFTASTSGGYNVVTTGSTVNYNGTGTQSVLVNSLLPYNNLTVSNTSAIVSLSGAATVNGTLSVIADAILDLGTNGSLAGTFTAAASQGTIRTAVAGATPITSGKTWGGTVEYYGTSAQTIVAGNYNILNIIGSRGANSITFINAGTIGIAGSLNASATFGGVSYIVTGNTVDFNGTGAQTIPAFNFNSLTISGARGTNTITLANGTVGIAGSFSITATGTPNYAVGNNTVNFNGTGAQTIPAFNYNNLTISGGRGTSTITLASGVVGIAGNLSITASGTLTYAVAGNTVNLNGSSAQSINFNNITINALQVNGGGTKTLTGAVIVTSGLALNDGVVVTTATNILEILSAGSITGGNSTTFIEGPLRRILNNASGTFPLGSRSGGTTGTSPVFAPLTIGATGTGGNSTVLAQYFRISPKTLSTTFGSEITQIDNCEYWSVSKTGGNAAPQIQLNWDANSDCNGAWPFITNNTTLRVAQLVNTTWTDVGRSAGSGTTSGSITSNSAQYATNNLVNVPFTLASSEVQTNPLPVKFSAITAKKVTNGVQVDWTIDAEENTKGYEVERSADGRNFASIGFKAAVGAGKYNFTDVNPIADAYYRIRAIDNDGKYGFSNVVRMRGGESEVVIKGFFSNRNQITVQHDAAVDGTVISVVTADGQMLKNVQVVKGSQLTQIDVSSAKPGLLVVRYQSRDKVETMKMVKQ